jgi:hypothetical protein
MAAGDHYRKLAADLYARAKQEPNVFTRTEFENLAVSYLRLAEQADRNSEADLVYETPPPSAAQPQAHQQQQPQPDKDSKES